MLSLHLLFLSLTFVSIVPATAGVFVGIVVYQELFNWGISTAYFGLKRYRKCMHVCLMDAYKIRSCVLTSYLFLLFTRLCLLNNIYEAIMKFTTHLSFSGILFLML